MAALAAEVAAVAADRHDLAVGPVVVHRLVADGFDLDRRDDSVGQVVQRAVAIHVCLAKAALTVTQAAAPQAQIADDIAIFEWLLQLSFNELIAFGHGGTS